MIYDDSCGFLLIWLDLWGGIVNFEGGGGGECLGAGHGLTKHSPDNTTARAQQMDDPPTMYPRDREMKHKVPK